MRAPEGVGLNGLHSKLQDNHAGVHQLETNAQRAARVVMDTVIENQRRLLEERERVEEALVHEKMLKRPNVCEGMTSLGA